MFAVGGFGSWVLGAGYCWVLGTAGCWVLLGAGCWVLGAGYCWVMGWVPLVNPNMKYQMEPDDVITTPTSGIRSSKLEDY